MNSYPSRCAALLALLSTLALASPAPAQLSQAWVARYNGPANGTDTATAMTVDASGNVYVTGESSGDIATIKYGPSGNQIWIHRYNGPGNGTDRPSAIAVDGAGNVHVAGYSWGGSTQDDYVTIKYGPDGVPSATWPDEGFGVGVRRYNGPRSAMDRINAMKIDSSGNVYVTGQSDAMMVTGAPQPDFATIKYDANGNTAWVARYGNSNLIGDIAYDLAVDAAGNVYVTGWTAVGNDYLTVKYGPDGQPSSSWPNAGDGVGVRRLNGPQNSTDTPIAIAVDASGNVYVTGRTPSTITAPFYSIMTVKYTAAGVRSWVVYHNSSTSCEPAALAVDNAGFIYVTGREDTSLPVGGWHTTYITLKYDANGSRSSTWPDVGYGIGLRRYDSGGGNDFPRAMTLDADGNVYVTGQSRKFGVNDYATVKWSTAGNMEWVHRYNGPSNGPDEAYAISVDAGGSVYVTGSSFGSNPDFATIKYSVNNAPAANAGADQTVGADANCQAVVALNGSASSDPDGDTLTYTWTGSFGTATGATPSVTLFSGAHTITLTVNDGRGGSASDTVLITVADVTPPAVACPADQTVAAGNDCQGAIPNFIAGLEASDNCTPSSGLNKTQSPLPGTLVGLGEHPVKITVTDAAGNSAVCWVNVTVVDATAPIIASLTASPDVLSPANGKMIAVTLTASVLDNCESVSTARIVSVTSNEPINLPGARKPDYEITGDLTLNLRAKSDTEQGRVYTVTVESVDASGNRSTASVAVPVASGGHGGGKGNGKNK